MHHRLPVIVSLLILFGPAACFSTIGAYENYLAWLVRRAQTAFPSAQDSVNIYPDCPGQCTLLDFIGEAWESGNSTLPTLQPQHMWRNHTDTVRCGRNKRSKGYKGYMHININEGTEVNIQQAVADINSCKCRTKKKKSKGKAKGKDRNRNKNTGKVKLSKILPGTDSHAKMLVQLGKLGAAAERAGLALGDLTEEHQKLFRSVRDTTEAIAFLRRKDFEENFRQQLKQEMRKNIKYEAFDFVTTDDRGKQKAIVAPSFTGWDAFIDDIDEDMTVQNHMQDDAEFAKNYEEAKRRVNAPGGGNARHAAALRSAVASLEALGSCVQTVVEAVDVVVQVSGSVV